MEDKKSLLELLTKFDNIFGVSGDESQVGAALKEEMEGFCDEFYEDAFGNHVFVRYGKDRDKRVMLAAHMDEIGFAVNYIEDNGFGRFMPVGFHDDRMCVNQDMVVKTDKGPVYGVTGSKPAHIMKAEEYEKTIPIAELFVDFGTQSRKETEDLGVRIGDYMGFHRQGGQLNGGKYYTGKSVDDRSGCAVLVELFKRLKDVEIEPTLYAVGTVQEEVGMRGGPPAANRIKPELMLALDVTLSGGAPGVEMRECSVAMGKGPAINFFDWDQNYGMTGNNVPKKLTRRLVQVAEENNIPYQRQVMMGGGTDAWPTAMSGEGVLAGGLDIPSQYIHTAVGTVNMDDMEHMVTFLMAYFKDYKTL